MYNEVQKPKLSIGYWLPMTSQAYTLGQFIADLMRKSQHNNSSLAAEAGVSESVIRNLLKHGIDSNAKDPDPQTLRRVGDALGVDSLKLFRLAGYIPPESDANSVRAEYLADVFDQLSSEKQDAVMGVLEAMAENPRAKQAIQEMRGSSHNALAGVDLSFPDMIRQVANQLITTYAMTEPSDTNRIEPDAAVFRYRWAELPPDTRERIIALIRHKISLNYDPTMVDEQWRK